MARVPLRLRPLPRPQRPTYERRCNRAEDAHTALQLALTAASRRSGLDVVLVADTMGMLVTSSRSDVDLSMLAAVTPIVGRGQGIPRIKRDGKKRSMSVRPMQLFGETLYVAAVGGSHNGRRRELAGGCAVLQRILG
jgi:ketopantoate hydroxymethyltransferase